MTINVMNKNGIRYGSFDIHGIQGNFPNQAIISTNLNHIKYADQSDFDFQTKILEIVSFFPSKLRFDSVYRKKKIKEFSKIIQENPDKLCLLAVRGVRGNFKMTKEINEFFIQFQIECGFKIIKAFFQYERNALENLEHYRSMIPNGCSFVAVLDENLKHQTFRSLYENCYNKGDEIICFLGRKPSRQKSKNIKNKLNFNFILRREDDKILRLISFAPKSNAGIASSYVYQLFGIDVYSFMTRLGSENVPQFKLMALNGFRYELLLPTTSLICVLTGKNLYQSSKWFESEMEKSSLPVSVHTIIELNNNFKDFQEKHTREELEEIVGNRFYRFSP